MDPKKEDNEIFIYPTNKDCESRFEYVRISGELSSKDSNALKTIEVLGLNSNPSLSIRRKAKILEGEGFRDSLFLMSNDPSMIKSLIEQKVEFLYRPNQKGFLSVMCFVVVAAITGRTS